MSSSNRSWVLALLAAAAALLAYDLASSSVSPLDPMSASPRRASNTIEVVPPPMDVATGRVEAEDVPAPLQPSAPMDSSIDPGSPARGDVAHPLGLPPQLEKPLIPLHGELSSVGLLAQKLSATGSNVDALFLLVEAVSLQLETDGVGVLRPSPGHAPGRPEAAKAFPPPAPGQYAYGAKGKRYHFYPEDFPLFAKALDRSREGSDGSRDALPFNEQVAWSRSEVDEALRYAADAVDRARGL